MQDNISREDLTSLRYFLGQAHGTVPKLTNGQKVQEFEQNFSQWLGSKFAVMVNSGASANLLTMQALRIQLGRPLRVAVPCITWVSDIAAVIHAGHQAVFVDVDPFTLGMDLSRPLDADVIFLTHCLGFNALQEQAVFHAQMVIEDCCEATGGTYGTTNRYGRKKKLGTFGYMSNFSFYYAHHMSTIEGGMICTESEHMYELLRMLRSHGLVREMRSQELKEKAAQTCPDLSPDFIFSHPAYNVRPTEINAVLGLAQMERLEYGCAKRTANLVAFLEHLDPAKYRTRYRLEGSSNYALPLILQEPDHDLMAKVEQTLKTSGVEYRKGTAGGGNQLRQPYARERFGHDLHKQFPVAEHIHQFGLYLGNFPALEERKIALLTERLNAL